MGKGGINRSISKSNTHRVLCRNCGINYLNKFVSLVITIDTNIEYS